jgi:AcrR family transcriptional regulator
VVGSADAALAPGKGERTRARLLDLAVARFAAEGYRRTSVSEIARDAGLTPAAVYAYFAGKDALFKAAVDADAAALIEESRADATAPTLRDRLGLFVAVLFDRLDDHLLARRVLSGYEPEVVGRLLDLPSLKSLVADISADVAVGQEAGEIRGDVDPATTALGLETIVLALLMAQLQTGVAPSSERSVGALVVLDAALRPPQ